jgi:coenzyme Q-binding protein COQ10
MYALVADIQHYPEFLPLCEGLQIRSRASQGDGEVLTADMQVGYMAIRESFTTRVTLDPETPSVVAEHIRGPFRHLINRWHFYPQAGGCDVDFFISYEFQSPMLQMMVGAMFDTAFRRFTEAFEDRAREIYGSA